MRWRWRWQWRFTNPLTQMRVKQQLILLFLVLVGPVFLFNWYANMKAEQILKRHVTNAYVELSKQNYLLISRDIDTVSRIMTTIIQNPITQKMHEPASGTLERVQQYIEADKALATYSMGMNQNGEAVYYYLYVYDPHGEFDFAPKSSRFKTGGVYYYSDNDKPEWVDEAIRKKGKGYLQIMRDVSTVNHPETLAYIRAVNSVTEGNSIVGVLVATNINKKIELSLDTVSLPDSGEIYVTDYANRILASSIPALGQTLDLPDDLVTGDDPEGTVDSISSGYIYVEHYNYETQQKLIYKIPTRSMLQQQNEMKRVIQLGAIVYLIFGFIVMAYFWRSLLTPMQKLAVFTRSYLPGRNVPTTEGLDRNDEIGVLIHSVYGMATRMNSLIEDRYVMEIKQKEAQLQILYHQINPHLLYNTLESIYWKSSLEGNSDSAEMIKELAKLMRISLSRGRELISLREELEHAAAYTRLQQKRYEYEFLVVWDVEDETLNNQIPKITLQPLIENAIIHGVRNMGDDGEIVVSAHVEEGTVVVRVEDNGYKEVDYAAIAKLLDESNENPQSGYGMRNVQQRIKLHFGPEYGIRFDPRPGGGTVVTIKLPVRPDDAEPNPDRYSPMIG